MNRTTLYVLLLAIALIALAAATYFFATPADAPIEDTTTPTTEENAIIYGDPATITSPLPTEPSPALSQVYSSQVECEEATSSTCVFETCDYVPEGMTPQEACPPAGPYEGWVPR